VFVLVFVASQLFGLDPFLWQVTVFLAVFLGQLLPCSSPGRHGGSNGPRPRRANLRIIER
jgi:hypothetical protein